MNPVQSNIMKCVVAGEGAPVSLSSGQIKFAAILVARGFIRETDGKYTITDEGCLEMSKVRGTRVYAYRAYAPIDGADDFNTAILAAHKLKNRLVEIEKIRRQKHDELMKGDPAVNAIQAKITAINLTLESSRTAIKTANRDARSKADAKALTVADRDLAKQCKIDLKSLYSELKAAKAAARETVRPILDAQAAEADKLIDEAVHSSGCYWSTYNALKKTVKKSGPPPKFRRFDGSGKLDCQLINGLSPQQVMSGGRYVGIEMTHGNMAEVTMRIGTVGEGRDVRAIMTTLPIKLHRPLRQDARVTGMAIVRERVACRRRYGLRVSMDAESWDKSDWATEGEVGIDIGWRIVPDGLRVAYWVGGDGRAGELILPNEDIARWDEVEKTQSERKRSFNDMRTKLAAWIELHFGDVEFPDWFIVWTEHLDKWLSPGRLGQLAAYWKSNRFAGDVGIAGAIEGWRRWDAERWLHEARTGERAINWRNEQYQQFAAFLRRNYATAFIEDTDWRALQDLPQPEEKQPEPGSRNYRTIASPGILTEAIRQNMRKTTERKAEKSTMVHHDCGQLSGQKDRASLWHVCQNCGEKFDQDRNAALNLLHGLLRIDQGELRI